MQKPSDFIRSCHYVYTCRKWQQLAILLHFRDFFSLKFSQIRNCAHIHRHADTNKIRIFPIDAIKLLHRRKRICSALFWCIAPQLKHTKILQAAREKTSFLEADRYFTHFAINLCDFALILHYTRYVVVVFPPFHNHNRSKPSKM